MPPLTTFEDSGWGEWLNRLDAALRWDRLTAGLRLDSVVYWSRPVDSASAAAYGTTNVAYDNESRFKNALYPAKLWVTYAAPGVEVTAGGAQAPLRGGLAPPRRETHAPRHDTTRPP